MKKQVSFSVLFWLNKSRAQNNEMPIYARVTVNGKRAEVSLQRKIKPALWDSKRSRAKGNNAHAITLNNFLAQTESNLTKLFTELQLKNERISAEIIKNYYFGKNTPASKTLLDVFAYHNAKMKEKAEYGSISPKTHQRFEILKNKVARFMQYAYKVDDMPIENIKYAFVSDMEHYLMMQQKLESNTAMKYIKMLKKIMNVAVANEWLASNPFMNFKCTYRSPEREILTNQELHHIYTKQMPNQRLEQVRDIFIFACYTGYAFSDLAQFERNAVVMGIDGEKWLKTNRIKTDISENVMLLDIPLTIIEKYRNEPYCVEYNKLLPVISNQRYNAYLKEMADICNINKHLTSHIARHTFATTVTLANGISLESVSAMLGHNSIRTTQIYAKVVQSKLSSEMKMLKQKLHSLPVSTAIATN
jgi:site-specific recombinase XerD